MKLLLYGVKIKYYKMKSNIVSNHNIYFKNNKYDYIQSFLDIKHNEQHGNIVFTNLIYSKICIRDYIQIVIDIFKEKLICINFQIFRYKHYNCVI